MSEENVVTPKVPAQEELQNFNWLVDNLAAGLAGAIAGMGCPAPSIEIVSETAAESPVFAQSESETVEQQAGEQQIGETEAAATPEPEPAEPTAEAAPQAGDTVWWAQCFNLHATHCIWAGASESARQKIASDALLAAGVAERSETDLQSTWQELVSQSMSTLALKLAARFGREVTCLSGQPMQELSAAVMQRTVRLKLADTTIEVVFAASTDFVQQLARTGFYRQSGWMARDQRSGDRRGPGARASDRREPEAADATKSQPDTIPIDSVLDMDIPVSISFGTARLRLDEALQLKDGSLVVLNRTIDELVELQVNGRAVARGEVVAVRGQYGIRIRELSSHRERLEHIDPERRPEVEASLNV